MLGAIKGIRSEICPYCFEHFKLGKTPFRCTSPMSRCAPEVDSVLERHWEDSRPMGKVLAGPGRFVRSVECPDCSNKSRKRLCPTCHSDLPHTTGDFKNYVFAVIGAKESGKSHYISVLINQIKKQVGPDLNMLLEPMNDPTIRRYRNDFYNPVYNEKRIIEATQSALANRNVQSPLVYCLTFTGKNLIGRNAIKKAAVLVFFDTAGEDLDDEDTMSTVNKYIYRSDGIILLIDPLQLPQVRNDLGDGTSLPGVNTETTDILTRTTRLIQKGQNIKPNAQIKIPLAVAFSKFDAVDSLVDDQFQLHANGRHIGGFDDADFQATNSEMMALLVRWDGHDLVQQVQTRYKRHGFFGLSALGCNPHGSKEVPRVAPRRVEDPFLWLLAENGLIGRNK